METGLVIGHWEDDDTGSMITLTKGKAHIVHRGRAGVLETPEGDYSDNPGTIGRMIAKKLNPQSTTSD
jgi:hypothetical protein